MESIKAKLERIRFASYTGLFALLLPAGCASTAPDGALAAESDALAGVAAWPQAYRSPRHTAFNDLETVLAPDNIAQLHPIWHRRVHDNPNYAYNVRVSLWEGRVIVGSYKLFAFQADTGVELWNAGDELTSLSGHPAVGYGQLYVPSENSFVSYTAKTATNLRYYGLPGMDFSISSPLVSGHRVFVTAKAVEGNDSAFLSAFGSPSEPGWSAAVPGRATLDPAAANGRVFAGGSEFLSAFDENNGALLWSVPSNGITFGAPSISSGRVFVTQGSTLCAFDERGGQKLWSITLPAPASLLPPGVAYGAAYIVTQGSELRLSAYDVATGATRFSVSYGSGAITGAPAVANSLVYLGSEQRLLVLRADTGAVAATLSFDGTVFSPAVAQGHVYVGAGQNVFALGLEPPVEGPDDAGAGGAGAGGAGSGGSGTGEAGAEAEGGAGGEADAGPNVCTPTEQRFTETPSRTDVTGGRLTALAHADQTTYLGGYFDYTGPTTGYLALLNEATGAPEQAFPDVGGGSGISALIEDGHGGYYIGGNFTRVGSLSLSGLAHLLPDHTVDLAFQIPVKGQVTTLALSGSTLYVGGSITKVGGKARSGVASIDLTAATVTPWVSGIKGRVLALALSGTELYVGGGFLEVQGLPRKYLVAYQLSTAALTSFDPEPSSPVDALAVANGQLYAGGGFKTIAGARRGMLAAFDLATGALGSFNPRLDAGVLAITPHDGKLFVGGGFTKSGDQTRQFVAAFDAASGSLLPFVPSIGPGNSKGGANVVTALLVEDDRIYVGGSFNTLGNAGRANVLALRADTGEQLAFSAVASEGVGSLAHGSGGVVAAGYFSSIGGDLRNGLVAIDDASGKRLPWNPGLEASPGTALSPVTALAIDGPTIFGVANGGLDGAVPFAADRSTGAKRTFAAIRRDEHRCRR